MILPAFSHRSSGFTLMELVIVLALFSLAIFMTTPYLYGTLEKRRLVSERDKVVFALKQAQQKSRVAQSGESYGISFVESDFYTSLPEGRMTSYKHGVIVDSSADLVFFRKLTGHLDLTPDGDELTLTLNSSRFSTTIHINSYGVLNTTSPQPL